MKTPKSTLELADAIESLVASYVESVREAAQQAVARATVERVASAHSSSSGTRTRAAPPQTTMARRTSSTPDNFKWFDTDYYPLGVGALTRNTYEVKYRAYFGD